MKRGGKGSGAGAAATTVLLVALLVLVAASMRADAAAAARRLGDPKPNPNPCTYDQNNPGHKCRVPTPPGKQAAAAHTEAQSRRLISVSKASLGPSGCTNDPNAPPGKKCPAPPAKAP
ncbi:hypothetical protein BAE44_0009481 [Dichanthelium oligosanthes]|uniref:Uncharacterized protein n=1 Tax=Dichanthelium oligosanthes TaxID=888268 RepID=A0A1E5VWL3_9POAL|nr:hypothetical protein BAE44_0009481 [Dichanthelium oligosanthes]